MFKSDIWRLQCLVVERWNPTGNEVSIWISTFRSAAIKSPIVLPERTKSRTISIDAQIVGQVSILEYLMYLLVYQCKKMMFVHPNYKRMCTERESTYFFFVDRIIGKTSLTRWRILYQYIPPICFKEQVNLCPTILS